MVSYDEAIADAAERQRQARQLEAQLDEVEPQLRTARERAESLRRTSAHEDADVDRLERVSLASLWSKVTGKSDEKLNREKVEAHFAQVQLDEAAERLRYWERVHADLQRRRWALGDPDGDHAAALGAKERELVARGNPATIELTRINQEQETLARWLQAYDEALSEGRAAHEATSGVVTHVAEAQQAQAKDARLFAIFQHDFKEWSTMGKAQRAAPRVQDHLERFASKMADIGFPAEMDLPQLASRVDYTERLFDSVLTDGVRRDDLDRNRQDIAETADAVQRLINKVDGKRAEAQARYDDLITERNRVVSKARLG